jgi:F-type H+-transporting ATPase subunit a
MEDQVLGVTKLVNALLGKPMLALLIALHIQPANPKYPIPDHIAMEFVVFLIAIVFFTWLKGRLSVDNPGGTQQVMEMLLTNPMGVGARDLLEDTAGHHALQYLPMIGSIGLFVLLSNLVSLVPGFFSPTAEKTVPLGCAIVVFLYYNWAGIAHHGPGKYASTFLGPVLAMSPIMAVVEVFSHFARMLSLTVRLWVNMLVSELLYVTFLGLTVSLFLFVGKLNGLGYLLAPIPLLAPCIFILLHIFVAFVQAFVFTLLPIIYVGGAVAEEH